MPFLAQQQRMATVESAAIRLHLLFSSIRPDRVYLSADALNGVRTA